MFNYPSWVSKIYESGSETKQQSKVTFGVNNVVTREPFSFSNIIDSVRKLAISIHYYSFSFQLAKAPKHYCGSANNFIVRIFPLADLCMCLKCAAFQSGVAELYKDKGML